MVRKDDMTFREQMDGFPWAQIIVISLVRTAEPIAFTSLFTYVYFMVRDFGIADTDEDVSKYAGFMTSSFAFCQVMTGMFWGKFADSHGRKPTLVMGLTGCMISILLFGFAKNYWYALVARCLMGTLNGNVAVVRTMLGEVAKEKKHQALAFSVMPLCWNVGSVIGPLIGGYLSGKETKYHWLRPLTEKYPYARPNIVIGLILVLSMLVALFFLEETHYKYRTRHDYFLEIGDRFMYLVFGVKVPLRPWEADTSEVADDTPLLTDSRSNEQSDYESIGSTKSSPTRERTKFLPGELEDAPSSMRDILTVPIIMAVGSLFLNSLHTLVADEFLPIFLSTPIARAKDGSLLSHFPLRIIGGLDYTSEATGTLLSSTGMVSIFFIFTLLPHVNRKLEPLTIYRIFCAPMPFIYFLIPYVVLLADNLPLAKFLLYAACGLRSVCLDLFLAQLNMIVHVSAPSKSRGLVNGISISSQALSRCIGPFLWGFIMSFGQKHDVGWLPWWCLAALGVVIVWSSQYLTDGDETKN